MLNKLKMRYKFNLKCVTWSLKNKEKDNRIILIEKQLKFYQQTTLLQSK
jgi:hypothetical protein